MGQEEVVGYVDAGGDGGTERKDGGLEEDGPRTAKSICERILTVPCAANRQGNLQCLKTVSRLGLMGLNHERTRH